MGANAPALKSFAGFSTHPLRVLIIGAAKGFFKALQPERAESDH